jgi:hypothetical protein
MTARVVPLHGAEIIDRRDPVFWRDGSAWKPPSFVTPEFARLFNEPDADAKLRVYERVLGGDDDGGAAA